MSKELIPVFALFIADEFGNFDWIYTAPKPYYETREEAEKIRKKLIQEKEKITTLNTRVQKLWKIVDSKKELRN